MSPTNQLVTHSIRSCENTSKAFKSPFPDIKVELDGSLLKIKHQVLQNAGYDPTTNIIPVTMDLIQSYNALDTLHDAIRDISVHASVRKRKMHLTTVKGDDLVGHSLLPNIRTHKWPAKKEEPIEGVRPTQQGVITLCIKSDRIMTKFGYWFIKHT
jgi:hypothetical protein